MLTRFPGWPERLEAFLAESRNKRFRYGSWDCCLFVCDAILAMTGVDVAEEFRGRYKTRTEAMRLAGSVLEVTERVTSANAMPEIAPRSASRGDVVLIKHKRSFLLGVVALNGRAALSLARNSIVTFPMSSVVRAWRT